MLKIKIISFVLVFLMGTIAVFAENKTEKFKVYGSCGMCEQRIEKTVKSMNGVTKADWYKETKMLKVTFDESKVKLEDIQKKLAEVGHDTNRFKASDKVYKALPECCKYRE